MDLCNGTMKYGFDGDKDAERGNCPKINFFNFHLQMPVDGVTRCSSYQVSFIEHLLCAKPYNVDGIT